MIIFSSRYHINNLNSIFFEFIIDDYQIHDNPVQNMLGSKVGFEGQAKLLNYNFIWEAEYTQIDSWTYIHHGNFTNWQNRGHAIGYPYGSDLRSLYFHAIKLLKNDNIIFTVQDYPFMATSDSNFIYNNEIVSAIEAGGYIFNDSINVGISFTMKNGSGNDTTYTFSDISEDDLLDFQKISLIDLSEHEMEGKDSLIISYTLVIMPVITRV